MDIPERGLRILGLWPGTFDAVAAAPTRDRAAAELASVKDLAKAAKRQVALRHHPDHHSPGKRREHAEDLLRTALEAADWVEARTLDEVRPRRHGASGGGRDYSVAAMCRDRHPVTIEASTTGIRIRVRGTL